MKIALLSSLALSMLLLLSCGKKGTGVEADLIGYELSDVPNSDFRIATMVVDGKKVQEGYVLNAKRNGLWLDFAPDGRISGIHNYVNGQLNGPSMVLERGQITAQAEYKAGVYHGLKGTYKFGRPIEEIPYVDGKVEGVMRKYYNNSKLMEEAEYKNNVQDGYYRHYNEEGVIDLEYVYKAGEKVSGGIVEPPKEN